MKKFVGSLLVVAGLAMSANAQVSQRSQFKLEFSRTGAAGSWSSNLDVNTSGGSSRVFGRVTVSYVANGGPTPLFFNGGRFQPQGAGWATATDTVLPINPTGRVTADYSDTDGDGLDLGRVFGATSVTAVQAYQYAFGGANYLRFAEINAANHPGQGAGADNVTGSRGINTSNNTLAPQLGTSDVELFVWGMDFAQNRIGAIDFTILQEGFRTSGGTANPPSTRSATWVTNTSPFTAVEAPTLATLGGTVTLVPAPGAAALLGLGGMIIGRRRR